MPALFASSAPLLRWQVELQRRTARSSLTGGRVAGAWVTYATVYADLEEATSARAPDERLDQDVALYGRPSSIKIRWRGDVTTADRVRIVRDGQERILQIVGTAEIGRRRWLQLAIREWTHE